MKRTTIKLLILALASVLLLALAQSAYAEPTYSVTLIAYDKTNGINEAGGEVAFSDSGKGTTISGNYGENTSRIIGVYPASDYTFTGWAKGSPTGEIVSTASPYTFTVTEAVTFYALFEKVITYPVWVGDTQVTESIKDDILGDGGKAKYDPDTHTLTLSDPVISNFYNGAKIYADGVDLTINGSADLTGDDTGIEVSGGSLTLNGNFTVKGTFDAIIAVNVTVSGGNVGLNGDVAINASGNLSISGGTVTADCNDTAISVDGDIMISGGTVTATAQMGSAISADGNITISNADVTADGDTSGIYSEGKISISGNLVKASGLFAGVQAVGDVVITGGTVDAQSSNEGEPAVRSGSQVTISDSLEIKKPEGGIISSDKKMISNSDGTAALTVLIVPKEITYPVWVGSTQVTESNKDNILGDGKAKFDPSTITLTLNNPIITGTHSNSVIYAENVHLNLVGSANIIDDTAQTGILVVHHSLTLNGDFNVSGAAMKTGIYASASIEVKGGTISAAGSSEGIRAASNNVTISGGEVTAKGVGSNGYGIFSFGNLTISGGTVTATGEKYGIYADNNATISGGTVTATGSEAGTGGGAGIYALNSVSISNGTVTAKGRVRGIHAGINLSISGGSVAAETWVANESKAIFAEDGTITISGGSVEAKTAAIGIDSGGKINIENGTKKVESTAGKQAVVATMELTIGDELMIKAPEGGKISSDNLAILNADDTTATHALIVPKEITYPVWVGSTQVTESIKDDILGDGGKAKYDPETQTLTLNNPTISGEKSGAKIYIYDNDKTYTIDGTATIDGKIMMANGWDAALVIKGNITTTDSIHSPSGNITVDGKLTVTANSGYGINSGKNITIQSGTVSVTDTTSYGDAISTQNITISDGTVTATGGKKGIHANGSVIISGGTVTAEAMKGDEGTGIFSENGEITITGGSVKAAGQASGIYATVGDIEIANGTASVEADGDYVAIHSNHGTIIIGDELMIKEPTGGKLSSDNKSILNADDTTATHALIVPKEITYPVWVAGIQATESNKDDMLGDGKVSFDPASNTLTLNGAAINTDGMHASGAAIVSESIDLTVKGSFTTSSTGYGILAVQGSGTANLTLDGVTATLTAIDTGIAADGNVTIYGGTVSVTSTSSDGNAISTQNITISDGTVTATGGKNGIHANGSVIISGGTVTAEAVGKGICAGHGNITISGGTVKATSSGMNAGIEAINGKVDIKNGINSVTADGGGTAIGAGSIAIGDELMIKEPEGGTVGDIPGAYVIKNADDTTATHALIVPKEKTYVLWVDVTPAGSGKLELAAEAGVWVTLIDLSFPAGEHTLTAKAEDGYVFKEWRDAEADTVISTANPFTFTLNKDVHYTAVFEKITYAFTKGDGAVWTKGSAAGLDFTVKGSPDDTNTFVNFTGIQIDGAAVAAGNYTAAAGSVELTLNPAYLETLAVGSHTIKAEFKDGIATAAFAVKEQDTCIVSFDPNGGTGAMASVTVNAGEFRERRSPWKRIL